MGCCKPTTYTVGLCPGRLIYQTCSQVVFLSQRYDPIRWPAGLESAFDRWNLALPILDAIPPVWNEDGSDSYQHVVGTFDDPGPVLPGSWAAASDDRFRVSGHFVIMPVPGESVGWITLAVGVGRRWVRSNRPLEYCPDQVASGGFYVALFETDRMPLISEIRCTSGDCVGTRTEYDNPVGSTRCQ